MGGATAGWYEVSRSVASIYPTVPNLRASGVPEPIAGWTTQAITGVGGTITFTPGTSKGYQIITGSAALAGNWTIAIDNGVNDGDEFWIDYRATMTPGAFVISVEGTTLTSTQTLAGKTMIHAIWSTGAGLWIVTTWPGRDDYATLTDLAAKEASLGNPASNGMVLASTTGGVRSWIAQSNSVLENVTANTQTTAITTEEILKTYTLTGGTLDTDGDQIEINGVYQTAANGNNKTETIKFGATTVATTGVVAFNNVTLSFRVIINRTGAATQSAIGILTSSAGAVYMTYSTPAETLSGSVAIQMCSTNGTAAAGDSIARWWSIRKNDK